ncbi:ATPase/protein kinase [Croceivirga lutea]|uniref:methylmalonyl Co-A mutase-associated GTPase MeaB n=1 Tax=Croceivirga lutea TaxID=1775167 RepID=UPI00163A6ED2|nr:methylmalonyl Co-A mutase-associated GTPase MeaB [Croceivirga lutea]GGG49373.1 ATPase/protein kinase [Croceivirga lutea]
MKNRLKNEAKRKALQLKKEQLFNIETLYNGLISNDRASLSKAITLVESSKLAHYELANQLLEKCIKHTNTTIRIGVTGVPGAGKSTFIEAFGKHLTTHGKKVAVLAVDPTSSLSSGSILGDKTRMETLAKDPLAFIRPSPAGTSLGGVTRKTRETIVLCEAAGYDVILVETVGVGQSETIVHSMVDFFLLLKLAGAGDELQGIKRGIIEMADAIVINKADGDNVKPSKLAKVEFERALHLYPPKENGWLPKVLLASSTEKQGIEDIWSLVNEFYKQMATNGYLEDNRLKQLKQWFLQNVENLLKAVYFEDKGFTSAVEETLKQIETKAISPFRAASKLVNSFHK